MDAADRFLARVRDLDKSKVSVDISKTNSCTAHIEAIWSEVERGAGHASQMLDNIASLASEEGVDLTLVPYVLRYDLDAAAEWAEDDEIVQMEALNQCTLDNSALQEWYSRHGFEWTGQMDGDHPVMRRSASEPVRALRSA